MFNVDENLNMTGDWVSDSFIRVFGWTVNEIQAMGGWQKCFYEDDLPAVMEHAKKVLSGHPDKIECRMVTKFGDILWIRDYAVPIFDNHSNRVIKIFGVAEDITEEKKLVDEINQRKEFFERLAQSTNAAIFVYQGEHFVYANRATELITGYTNEELLKMKFYELVHPDFREMVKQRGLQRQMGLPVPRSYEFKIITKNGEEKWIDFTGIIINWSGKPAGLGTAYDITPLKKAILELEKSNERYITLFENAPIGIFVLDPNGLILSVNKKYEDITGYKREELLNQNVGIVADPENIPFVDENIQRILNGEILNHIVKSKRKDGSEIYVHLIETKIPISEDQFGILSFCEDLTDKVKLEQQLIENERKLRTIFETANEGMCIADENDTITKVNQKFCEMTGYSENELIGKNFDDLLVHPEEIKDALLQKEKRSHGHLGNYERRIVRKDGNVIWVRVAVSGIFGENNEFIGSFGFFTDITEQKKLEEELKQSEEQFRLIWENSKDGMRLTDENGVVILVNPAFCELVGLKKEEIEGKTLAEIY
jgi:PAS domain S-box-containing protein